MSAEHGIGISKIGYLPYSKKKPLLDLMAKLKAQIDPRGIMNPYKIFGSVPRQDWSEGGIDSLFPEAMK